MSVKRVYEPLLISEAVLNGVMMGGISGSKVIRNLNFYSSQIAAHPEKPKRKPQKQKCR